MGKNRNKYVKRRTNPINSTENKSDIRTAKIGLSDLRLSVYSKYIMKDGPQWLFVISVAASLRPVVVHT